jgi:hypothetical protein
MRLVGGLNQRGAIEEQRFSGVDGQDGGVRRRITSMVRRPMTGTSKRMSWRGLLTFTTTRRWPPVMRAARSMVSSVPSMASIATQARSRTTTVWPRSSPRFAGRCYGRRRRPRFLMRRERDASARRAGNQRGQERSGIYQLNSLLFQHAWPPRQSANSCCAWKAKKLLSPASNPGRIALKILLCFTCPAITACFTPSLCNSSMARLSSPRLSQCRRAACFSSSGEASSRMAKTAISMPWLRAPSKTRNGKSPLPAIKPQPPVVPQMIQLRKACCPFISSNRGRKSIR